MLGLIVYSFINVDDIDFYRAQRTLAKKVDVLDWLPGSYLDGVVEGEGYTLARARRNVSNLLTLQCYEEPLAMLHLGRSFRGARGDEEEEEEEEVKEDQTIGEGGERPKEDAGVTMHTQQLEVPKHKKVMVTTTLQSNHVLTSRWTTLGTCMRGMPPQHSVKGRGARGKNCTTIRTLLPSLARTIMTTRWPRKSSPIHCPPLRSHF